MSHEIGICGKWKVAIVIRWKGSDLFAQKQLIVVPFQTPIRNDRRILVVEMGKHLLRDCQPFLHQMVGVNIGHITRQNEIANVAWQALGDLFFFRSELIMIAHVGIALSLAEKIHEKASAIGEADSLTHALKIHGNWSAIGEVDIDVHGGGEGCLFGLVGKFGLSCRARFVARLVDLCSWCAPKIVHVLSQRGESGHAQQRSGFRQVVSLWFFVAFAS